MIPPFQGRCFAVGIASLLIGCAGSLLAAPAPEPTRVELSAKWSLASAENAHAEGAAISRADFNVGSWHRITRLPATVLEILQEDGVYHDLYVGDNLQNTVPPDLYKRDWWYRTAFDAPVGTCYTLEFPGINYRAEVWLNGEKIADNQEIVGMYVAHELNVTSKIKPGSRNVLAVKVTPEQLITDVTGIELADSWFDWVNWKFNGYKGPNKFENGFGVAFAPDRNAGIWKPVYLRVTGPVSVTHAAVNSDLNLESATARLTVYAIVRNLSTETARGMLTGAISRPGKPPIHVEQAVADLRPGEEREIALTSDTFPQLVVKNPDLWWPYTMGSPALYDATLKFAQGTTTSDIARCRFGIRSVTQHRDTDESFPDVGKGGNFYLKVNGRDFRVRGADYTPDLLYRYDPDREADLLRYVKDLGLNFIRSESKIASEHLVELADEQGIPLMFGWMCCNPWEKWDQWSDEDRRVAPKSLRSQILMLRPHASVFAWANGSDGRPPEPILRQYHQVLSDLHWQNVQVDTVAAYAQDANGNRLWDGIRMQGPYCWRPPSYWYDPRYSAACGSNIEQGDNEHIPTLESLRKFIPPDRLWPINDTWFAHAGAWGGNNTLANIRLALEQRYGPSTNVEDFVRKAQLAHYENTRAQFESWAALPWANHKMIGYWMLNNHWPSFYGHLIDYYLSPDGAYYAAKKGLRPVSAVFDYYATGDRTKGRVLVFNQTTKDVSDMTVRVRVYDLDGTVRDDRSATHLAVPCNGATEALTLPRYPTASPVFFVRCQLFGSHGQLVVNNVYWVSQRDDDVGPRENDQVMTLKQERWADMTALNDLPPVALEATASETKTGQDHHVTIRLRNTSNRIAFFERVSLRADRDGDEILPVEYDDNYITVFPGETEELHGTTWKGPEPKWITLEGYNTRAVSIPVR